MKEWIVFSLDGREICRLSLEGATLSEIYETVGLLAYTKNVDRNQIKVALRKERK